MATHYRHTQKGYIILGSVGGTALVMIFQLLLRKAAAAMLIPGLLGLGLVGWVFSSLTLEVTDDELRASFGPGWQVKRVKLRDIAAVRRVRNPWYYGWGFRITPRGMLYNVSGMDAVEVTMRDGSTFRLGTDEPERLHEALEGALSRASG